jgi:hypothetical protein
MVTTIFPGYDARQDKNECYSFLFLYLTLALTDEG